MYATDCLMVIHPCAIYGMLSSQQKKKLWARNESADRWTNRWRGKQTVIPIYPTELCLQGV